MSDEETAGERLERLRTRLNKQQRTFCELYLKELDEVVAYRIAYKKEYPADESSASKAKFAARARRLLGLWYIQDYLGALTEASSLDDCIVTRTDVLANLAHILRDGDDKNRVAAAKVIAHVRGFGVKKVEHSGKVGHTLEGLSEEQIAKVRADFLGIDPSEDKV